MHSQDPTNLTDHYYQLLGVSLNASEDEIRRAYRRMAMQWHPDRNKSPDAPQMMRKINQAWEILGNPESKAKYDRDYFRLHSILAEAQRRGEERRQHESRQREAERLDTQLLTAIRVNRSSQEISTLIDKGADTNARTNHGATPLHYAARYNENPEVIQMLISRGAYINARTNSGQTPLHYAARFTKNPAVIDVFVSRGAYLSEPDINGLTPLHYAARYNENPDVFRLLRSEVARLLRSRSATSTSSSGHSCVLSMLWSFFRQ